MSTDDNRRLAPLEADLPKKPTAIGLPYPVVCQLFGLRNRDIFLNDPNLPLLVELARPVVILRGLGKHSMIRIGFVSTLPCWSARRALPQTTITSGYV